jgi:hypothetical protein
MPINDGCTPSSSCMLLSTPGIDCIGRFLDCDEPNPTLHAHIHRKATAKPMNPDQNPPPPSQPPPQKYPTTAANDFTPVRIQKPKEDLKIAVEGDAELERADKNKDGFLDQQEMLDAFDENSDKVLDRDEMAKVQRAKKRREASIRRKSGKGVPRSLWTCHKILQMSSKPLYVLFYCMLLYQVQEVYNSDQFNANKVFKDRLIETSFKDSSGFRVTFQDIQDVESIWKWIYQVFVPSLAPSSVSQAMEEAMTHKHEDGSTPITLDGVFEIKSMPQIRQVRSADRYSSGAVQQSESANKWLLHPSNKGTACDYTSMTGGIKLPCDTCQPFVYNDNKTVQCGCPNATLGSDYVNSIEPTWMGEYLSYDGNGYMEFFPMADGKTSDDFGGIKNLLGYHRTCSQQRLASWYHNDWIDQYTRAILLTFCVMPITIGTDAGKGKIDDEVVGCFRAVFEINRYGDVRPHYGFYSSTTTTSDELAAVKNFSIRSLLTVIPVLRLIEEAFEYFVLREAYCEDMSLVWNFLDLSIASMSILSAFWYDPAPFGTSKEETDVPWEMNGELLTRIYEMDIFLTMYGSIIFLTTLRIAHVTAVYESFKLPVLTLFAALYRSLPFILFLAMWMVGGTFMGLFIFGSKLESFSTVYRSLVTFARLFIGDIDFDQFHDTDLSMKGPILMSLFCGITLYIVFTMFVSIIDAVYNEIKESLEKNRLQNIAAAKQQQAWCGSIILSMFSNLFRKLFRSKTSNSVTSSGAIVPETAAEAHD